MNSQGSGKLLLALIVAVLCALAWFATDWLAISSTDATDEAEWTAISVVHVRQLGGQPPPGIEMDQLREKLHEDPWRQGAQGTTFGWANPGLHKLLWGLACESVAPEEIDALVFFRYNRGDQLQETVAKAPLEEAIQRARLVVAAASAGCAVLLFLIAKRVCGWLGGAAAFALWLLHPLVRQWSHQARPDFGMVLLLLGTILLTMIGAAAIRGESCRWKKWLSLLGIGLLAGLCAAVKLNGALAGIFVALALPLVFVGVKGKTRWRGVLAAWSVCGVIMLATLWANFPYLWSHPGEHLADVLAFWEKHMGFQQERWELAGGIATRTLGERIDLVSLRLCGKHEPLGAVFGLGGGAVWISAGVLALGYLSLRKTVSGSGPAGLVLLVSLVTVIGTLVWLPLDWERYFFAPVACLVLIEASLIGVLTNWVAALVRRRAPVADSP